MDSQPRHCSISLLMNTFDLSLNCGRISAVWFGFTLSQNCRFHGLQQTLELEFLEATLEFAFANTSEVTLMNSRSLDPCSER